MTSDIVTCPGCGQKNRVPADATGTPRCGKCQTDLPWLTSATGVARAAREMAGKLKVVKVNVDNAPRISQRFQARSIPMLVLLRDGNVVGQQVGAIPPDRLMAFVRKTLAP